jgi:hypothetical protein
MKAAKRAGPRLDEGALEAARLRYGPTRLMRKTCPAAVRTYNSFWPSSPKETIVPMFAMNCCWSVAPPPLYTKLRSQPLQRSD